MAPKIAPHWPNPIQSNPKPYYWQKTDQPIFNAWYSKTQTLLTIFFATFLSPPSIISLSLFPFCFSVFTIAILSRAHYTLTNGAAAVVVLPQRRRSQGERRGGGGGRWTGGGGDVHVAGVRGVSGGGTGAVSAREGWLPVAVVGGAGGAAGLPRGLLGSRGLEGPIWVQPVDRKAEGLCWGPWAWHPLHTSGRSPRKSPLSRKWRECPRLFHHLCS